MATYIFQANPDHFDVDAYLAQAVVKEQPIAWLVRQHKNKIQVGDTVYLWRSKGRQNAIAGVIARSEVVAEPTVMLEDAMATQYWKEDYEQKEEMRVMLEIQQLNISSKTIVKRDWLVEDPILADLSVLTQPHQTNFEVTDLQAARLASLVSVTGKGWGKRESMAALWLYNELSNEPISTKPDSPVAALAITIGRAVSSVYNKVMNYRSIDPRDDRKGLSGINKIDEAVWNAYFDPSTNVLQKELLDADFKRVWGSEPGSDQDQSSQDSIPSSEAGNDDVNDASIGKRRSRKSQRAFRKRLLDLYEGCCAISGVNVDSVLVAAHIVDHAASGNNHSSNGILLRSDLHVLFDNGLLTVDPDTLTVKISDELKDTEYWPFNDQKLRVRFDGSKPSAKYLRAKNRAGG